MPPPAQRKREVTIFGLVSFLNDMGSDMIFPIWPLFLTTVLGANMAVVGLIDGLGDAIVSISQAVSGYLSDRLKKRKVFIWLGYICAGVARLGYAFVNIWPQIIPFRLLDRSGKLRGAPRDAVIADLSTDKDRGSNFGFLRAMDNLGAVVGITITIFFFEQLGFHNLFLIAAVPSFIGVLLILFLIPKEKKPETKIFKGITLRELSPRIRYFIVLSAIFALGAFSYSFLLLIAKARGFSVSEISILYLIFTASASLLSIPFGRLCDRIGRKPVLVIAYLFWGLVSFTFIVSSGTLGTVTAFVLYGLHKAALDTSQKTFVSELLPVEHRGSALGGFQMIVGLCALPASLFAGVLWDTSTMLTPFYVSLGLTIVATVMLLGVKEKSSI